MPAKVSFRSASRVKVQELLRARTSTSPEASAVNRVCPVVGTKLTAFGSPITAAATARQTATSSPCQTPLASGADRPVLPVETPQLSFPRDFTSWRVAAQVAWEASTVMARLPMRSKDFFMGCSPLFLWTRQ
ncbi:hypothetical protein D3C84_692340 [compost metagenome]